MKNTLTLLLLLLTYSAHAEYGPYKAKVIEVKDGDTVEIDVAVWPDLTKRTRLRLLGIDTPEMRGRKSGKSITDCEKLDAAKATAFTKDWLLDNPNIIVTDIKPGKYARRMLGKISVPGKGDLGEALISAKLAKPYDGGKRLAWCE